MGELKPSGTKLFCTKMS